MGRQDTNITGPDRQTGEMTFWGHLEVLRWGIIRVAAALAVCMALCFIAMPHIFDSLILGPASSDFFTYKWLSWMRGGSLLPDFSGDFSVEIININVATQFTTHISTSFWLATIIVFPYIIYELWRFISPALYPKEKKSVGKAFLAGTLMFYIGCAVGYCLVFPFIFRFLTGYSISPEIANRITLNSYMSNFIGMIFMMGAVFELPLLAKLLSSLGVIDKAFLKKYRRHAIMILLVLAAVITPTGDPFSLAIVFLPLYLLYELSICIVRDKTTE